MEISQIIPHIEALIFASDKPLTSAELAELLNNSLGFIEDRANQEQVDAALEGIVEKYSAEFYPFEVKQSGGGWQFLTKKEYYKTVGQLNGDKFIKRLSIAALETLAIIAYKQPITKSEMEAIRGVNCDYAVQKLLEKDLVVIAGRREDSVGHPLIYATSKSFMDYFGINSADELPKISEVMMEELVESTMMHAGVPAEQEQESAPEAIADIVTDKAEQVSTDELETVSSEEAAERAIIVTEDGELVENSAPENPASEEIEESEENPASEEDAQSEKDDKEDA